MKLRLRDDTLRLRLTRNEVEQLEENGRLVTTTPIGAVALTYAVELSEGLAEPCARLVPAVAGVEVVVRLPAEAGREWARGEEVGLYGEHPSGAGTLSIAIEKDFRCLTPRDGEDADDAFPHPRAGEEVC